MIQNVSPQFFRLPPLDHIASYIGHGGDTYAFMSDNGFFPTLNASLSIIVNEDIDYRYPTGIVSCPIIELVAAAKGFGTIDLDCSPPTPPLYFCTHDHGAPRCIPSSHHGESKATCDAKCTSVEAADETDETVSSVAPATYPGPRGRHKRPRHAARHTK